MRWHRPPLGRSSAWGWFGTFSLLSRNRERSLEKEFSNDPFHCKITFTLYQLSFVAYYLSLSNSRESFLNWKVILNCDHLFATNSKLILTSYRVKTFSIFFSEP